MKMVPPVFYCAQALVAKFLPVKQDCKNEIAN